MIRTNKDSLVKMAVAGEISPPTLRGWFRASNTGQATIPIGMAGIVYNARVGDPAFGWEADHLEPGVSINNPDEEMDYAMHYLTCVGNEAVVTSGEARGAKGVVSGEHGRLLIDFAPEDLERMCVGDHIMIKAYGAGLELLDYPHISARKCSPELIEALRLEPAGQGQLRVPVAYEIPAHAMGSGIELLADFVDMDLMTGDRALMEELGLTSMRLGDLVAIRDHEHSYGRGYHKAATVIGLVIHGDSDMTGHGPGVLTLLSCPTPHIVPVIDPDANIGKYLQIGRWSERRG